MTTTLETYTLATRTGTMTLKPCGYGHIFVEGECSYFGKACNWTAHFHRWADGNFRLGEEKEQEYERNRSLYSYNGSDAFKKKVREEIAPLVRDWAESVPEIFRDVEQCARDRAWEERRGLIQMHLRCIAEIEREMEQLKSGENLPTYTKVKVR